jgi:potassium efflux system protein
LRQLFTTQRKYMDALIEDYETYFQKLVDFDARQQDLIDRTEDLLDFIDERILWIPSGKAVQPELLSDGRDAMKWLFGPNYWAQLGRALRDTVKRHWPLNILALLLAILFVPFARRARTRIQKLGEKANRPDCMSFSPTAEALGLTLLLGLWLPALLAYVGWRLGVSPAATQFTRSIAHGLLLAAAFWATLRVPRQLARPGGIAEAHCGWPEDASADLWRQLRWFAAVTVPAVFVISVFEMRGEDLWRESVGRLAFLITMIAITIFNYLALRPNGSIATVLRARKLKRPWVWRAFQLAAIAFPLVLCAAAFRGFYWTALQIAVRVHLTLVFLVLLVLITQLAARWAMIAERRRAREAEALEEPALRPPPTMQVSRWMIGTGVLIAILGAFAIWADLLPATRILHQVELWSSTQTVTVSEIDPSGAESVSTEERLVPITLADLLRSFLIGLLTLVLIRALPTILEATLFRRRGPGERYAYSTIVKYSVALAGVAIAFDAIGIGWSSIQWLVAAVGLGLGFGLQEIFANFVSGLIILFERPIRVGDTVTVGEVSGTVTKIRIRATWITAFDRKELVVPNKEFVTGRLINWTLSDAVLRIEIPVGIAYGSDTQRAIEVLKKVADESRRVLREPPPQVLFLGFGDSSLSFELRVFVRNVSQLFVTRHELHMGVDQAFREAGIEIAFPQRDLHVRSIPENWGPPKEPST